MEKYDPYNPNNLDDILKENKKEIKDKKDIGNTEAKAHTWSITKNFSVSDIVLAQSIKIFISKFLKGISCVKFNFDIWE